MLAEATSSTNRELHEVRMAESAERPVVLFLHGLWFLPECWDDWRRTFESHGYSTLAPRWPGQPTSVAEARSEPDALDGMSLNRITAHVARIISMLSTKPIVIGHCLGGLVAQQLAGRGLASATVAISPLPARGVVAFSPSYVRAAWPLLRNRRERQGTTLMPPRRWFRASVANAVDEDEARHLYERHAVPTPTRLLTEPAFANLNPRTEARVDAHSPARGPLKIISGQRDRLVPWSLARATFLLQQRSAAHTEFFEFSGRGHSMVIDSGWQEIADTSLRFVHRRLLHRSRDRTVFRVFPSRGRGSWPWEPIG